jgi:hypothetical protein
LNDFYEDKENISEYIVTIYLASSALDAAREVGLLDRKVKLLMFDAIRLDLYKFISTFSTPINSKIHFSTKENSCFFI